MAIKALFLDFYGTLVHEDDDIIPGICEQIRQASAGGCTPEEIGRYWWQTFSSMCGASFGASFRTQRELGIRSLAATAQRFGARVEVSALIEPQFRHWSQPDLYGDTKPFLEAYSDRLPVYILSNIDTADVAAAVRYHRLEVKGIVTSEDVRAYKPRPELFREGLRQAGVRPGEALHIGDSLASDVRGAQNAGIRAVWLNRRSRTNALGVSPAYSCRNLDEARELVQAMVEDGTP